MALGALAERRQTGAGRARFEDSVARISQAATAELPAALLQAFAAGAWWDVDPARSADLWNSALLWLNTSAFAEDAVRRHNWLMMLADALEFGAPQAALSVYLANPLPTLQPGEVLLIAPGPRVDPAEQTGMGQRDRRLALALAKLIPTASLPFETLHPPEACALLLTFASASGAAARLRQINAALDATGSVKPESLRWLLYARAVLALSQLGAHQHALARSATAVQAVTRALPVYGTIPVAGYAAALGNLAAANLMAGEVATAASLLFEGRRLGVNGTHRLLAELCPSLAKGDAAAWAGLLKETARAAV